MADLASRVSAALVAAGIPVDGISIGRRDDKSTWRIDFSATATAQQQAAGQTLITAFDPDAPDPEDTRLNTIKLNARQIALMNAVTTLDAPGIIAGVAARYPGLAGDGLKAVQDIALVCAVLAKR